MPQLFHRSANSISKISIVGGVIVLGSIIVAPYALDRGSFNSDTTVVKDQPVPFSHKHHITDDGIDCPYCPTSVETSALAGLPPPDVCTRRHPPIWDHPAL